MNGLYVLGGCCGTGSVVGWLVGMVGACSASVFAEPRWVAGLAVVVTEHVAAARAVPEQIGIVASQDIADNLVVLGRSAQEVFDHCDPTGERGRPRRNVPHDVIVGHATVMRARKGDAYP